MVITLPRLQCQPKGTQQLRVRMLVITLPTFTAPTQLYKSRLRQNREEVNQNPGYSESRLQIRAPRFDARASAAPWSADAARRDGRRESRRRRNPDCKSGLRAAAAGRGRAQSESRLQIQNPGCKSGLRAAGCEPRESPVRIQAANPGCGLREGRGGRVQSESRLQIRAAGCGLRRPAAC